MLWRRNRDTEEKTTILPEEWRQLPAKTKKQSRQSQPTPRSRQLFFGMGGQFGIFENVSSYFGFTPQGRVEPVFEPQTILRRFDQQQISAKNNFSQTSNNLGVPVRVVKKNNVSLVDIFAIGINQSYTLLNLLVGGVM
jgi:hypothetical protein